MQNVEVLLLETLKTLVTPFLSTRSRPTANKQTVNFEHMRSFRRFCSNLWLLLRFYKLATMVLPQSLICLLLENEVWDQGNYWNTSSQQLKLLMYMN